VAAKLAPPTVDDKPLTELVARRLELLVALLSARRRGVFSAPKEVQDVDPQRFKLMSTRLSRALAAATGASVYISPAGSALIPGEEARLDAIVANSGLAEINVKQLKFRGLGADLKLDTPDKIPPGTETSAEVKVTTPKTYGLSVPLSEHLYDGRLFGEPLTLEAELMIEGVSFVIESEARREIVPAVEIVDVKPSPYVTTPATFPRPLDFKITVQNHLQSDFRGLLRVSGQSLETGHELNLRPNQVETSNVVVRPLPLAGQIQGSTLAVTVDLPIPKEPIAKRSVPLVYAEALVVSGRKVGYVPSSDDTLERALAALGVDSAKLTADDIAKSDLSPFHTIVIDNRGYQAHPELVAANSRLLKFAEDGGTVVVFYHRVGEWNPQLAPFPISVGNDRVTEEDAPVTFLQPKHPLLNFPNKITQKDFANWIQERGLYFPSSWDPRYTAVLATNDTGEPPLKGGLLVAPYGKGNYIYTSFVWYRQLRAGHPGGYRFFANLISYGRRKE